MRKIGGLIIVSFFMLVVPVMGQERTLLNGKENDSDGDSLARIVLNEVEITEDEDLNKRRESSQSIDIVDDAYLRQNLGGSLMQSLERLPGVTTIDIGSGQSKPVIRGMSFNRVAVVENGIKHEAQQWGSDHGLEIDQYGINKVEIVKGPSSLMYGSDAIGGVVNMESIVVPQEHSYGGTVDLTAKTNNIFYGGSADFFLRKEKLFASMRFTMSDYGDYRVPTDYVDIYSYKVKLHNNRLRNTAGKEQDTHLNLGYVDTHFSSIFAISNVHSKSGFFANAHGLEPLNVDTEMHDASGRDILQPYQQVNHLKITNESRYHFGTSLLTLNLGFQRNHRKEYSQYTSHGYMPALFPDTLTFPSNLEREYDKYVYSVKAMYDMWIKESVKLTTGVDAEHQQNDISGCGFIIPAFKQTKAGIFAIGNITLSYRSNVTAGLRYDYSTISTTPYSDWFASPVTVDGNITSQYLQRAGDINRHFNSLTWSVGYAYNGDNISIKANAGKSFRTPIAQELAANGVNYHNYSYEVGDAALKAEESYQLDFSAEYSSKAFAIGVTPFINYFPNYIYLNPTSSYDRLYGNGNQVFRYTQSEVFRWGGEVHIHYKVLPCLLVGMNGEYVYSEQRSGDKKGFSLPFSLPASFLFNIKYSKAKMSLLKDCYVSIDSRITAKQTRIVPPEEETEGYEVFGLGAGFTAHISKQKIVVNMQVQNLFDTKYFNHTSFYRLINLPESGRNFIVNISIPFQGKIK